MHTAWNSWQKRFEATLQACAGINGDCRELVITSPATAQQVESVESKLGKPLPASFRKVLMGFSAHVEIAWYLPDDLKPPELLRGIFCGDCRWNIAQLADLEEERLGWVKHCFPNIEDPYDRIWHNKLAFQDIPNGDMLALDLDVIDSPVVYLSHEGDDFHGTILGKNSIDFVDRWSLIGFVGPEDWQLEKFVGSRTNGLEPYCNNVNKWREWFGLRIDLQRFSNAPLGVYKMNDYLYTAWFRDISLPPGDQDYEWPACLVIRADNSNDAKEWGDHLSKRCASNFSKE